MSLSYRQEEQHLRRLEVGVRRSDPHLGGMFGVFGRLYAGEGMPAWEQVLFSQDRSRPAAWIAAVLTAVAGTVSALLTATLASVTATRRARILPPTSNSKAERTRQGREASDQQDPPGPALAN